jgi:hypothetical protein
VGGSDVQPGPQRGAGGVVQRDLAVDTALAVADDDLSPPGGGHDVIGVERFDFLHAQAGVEDQQPDRGVAHRAASAAGADEPALLDLVQRFRRGGGDPLAPGHTTTGKKPTNATQRFLT